MAFADAVDVAVLMARELSEAEKALVDRRLAQVERMIARRIPDLVAQVSSGEIDHQDIVDVEADVVARHLRNPEGLASESDGGYSYQFSREVSSGRLVVLPDEWERLGVEAGKMFTIAPRLDVPA